MTDLPPNVVVGAYRANASLTSEAERRVVLDANAGDSGFARSRGVASAARAAASRATGTRYGEQLT